MLNVGHGKAEDRRHEKERQKRRAGERSEDARAGPIANGDGRDAYAFYEIQGKEVHEVAVGPVHAGVIEPGSFRFMCLGEQVHHLEIHLGYQHRGVEKMLLGGDARRLAPLVETIAGDTSIAHTWAYASAVEALAGLELGGLADAARGVMLELERIAMHLAGLAGMATDIGFLQGGASYGRLRTTAINASMRLCGSRFGRGAIRVGGLGARLEKLSELRTSLALLSKDVAIVNQAMIESRSGMVRRKKWPGRSMPGTFGTTALAPVARINSS